MTGIALKFEDGKALIDLGRVRSDVDHELQTALVVALTVKGSDTAFPTRGTTLHHDAVRGFLINFQSARHSANFAANDTMTFMNQTRTMTLTDLILDPVSFSNQRMTLDFHGFVGTTENLFSVVI